MHNDSVGIVSRLTLWELYDYIKKP